jgi:hypothetical protein
MKNFFKMFMGRSILDPNEAGLVTMTVEHAAIHAGQAYSARVSGAAVAKDALLYMELIIPTGLNVHLKEVELYTDGTAALLTILEAPTITNGTTAITPLNRNRTAGLTSQIVAYSDPSAISAGITLDTFTKGVNASFAVGGDKNDREWILKGGTKYLIEVQNKNASVAAIMYMNAFWYEYTI